MVDYQGCNSRNSASIGKVWLWLTLVTCVGAIFWCAATKIHELLSSPQGIAAPTTAVEHQSDLATHEGVK